jgi:hypothetical protein
VRNQQLERELSIQSAQGGGCYSSQFCVAGVFVRVAGHDRDAVALAPALLPFQNAAQFPNIEIEVEWVKDIRPSPGSQLFDSGALWTLHDNAAGYEFDFVAPVFGPSPYKRLLIDKDFSRATLKVSEAATEIVPETSPLDYPLDELLIMHRLTQEKAVELHGSGIVRANGIGNLFVGHSGAGKSTTTRLWTEREDVHVLSDDRIIVRRDPSCFRGLRMYGTPWHGEAMYASPGDAPLARIFILQHGRGNLLTRLSPSQAVAELFARSFVPFHRHEYVDSALAFLQEVAAAVPVYRYDFQPDQRAVDTILNFHD